MVQKAEQCSLPIHTDTGWSQQPAQLWRHLADYIIIINSINHKVAPSILLHTEKWEITLKKPGDKARKGGRCIIMCMYVFWGGGGGAYSMMPGSGSEIVQGSPTLL